jgi:hypothetical protein
MVSTLQATLAGNCPGSIAADCRRQRARNAVCRRCPADLAVLLLRRYVPVRSGAVLRPAALDLWNKTSTFAVLCT